MDPLGFAVGLAARASMLLGLCALALGALRRSSAGARQVVAMAGMAGALALPALSLVLPRWELAVWPAGAIEETPARDALVRFQLAGWVALAWGAVAVLSLSRLAVGMWRVSRRARRGRELDDALVARAAGKLGLRRRVRVVLCGETMLPMTAGLQEPVVILPAQAVDWSGERLELVLLHELAHVKRGDCLALMLAEIALASWWFHPLAWLARRSIRRDAELAADELVVRAGARPSVYAEHLLSLVRAARDSGRHEPALAMGRPSELDGRLRALLEQRERRPSAFLGRGIAASLIGLSLALASVWARAPEPPLVCPEERLATARAAQAR